MTDACHEPRPCSELAFHVPRATNHEPAHYLPRATGLRTTCLKGRRRYRLPSLFMSTLFHVMSENPTVTMHIA
eukprot:9487703-Pyramimonas_sp.AAC.2